MVDPSNNISQKCKYENKGMISHLDGEAGLTSDQT